MKFIANDYLPKDIFKIIRESTNLTQPEFGKTINRSERSVRSLETGERQLSVQTLLEIAKAHNIKIIIEKEERPKK